MDNNTTRRWGINFKPDLTLGNVIALVTIVTSAYGSYNAIQNGIKESSDDRKAIHGQIDSIQADRKETKEAILKAQSSLLASDNVQNNRLENFADRLTQFLNITIEQGKQLVSLKDSYSQLHEDMTLMRYALKRNGQELPEKPDHTGKQ